MLSTIPHKLIFNIFFQIFFKYIYQSDIVLFCIINLSLEFRNIFCCRLCLLYFLNLLFRDSVFIGDIENSANFFLENFLVFKKYFNINIAEIFQIYWYFEFDLIFCLFTEIDNNIYYFINSFYFIFFWKRNIVYIISAINPIYFIDQNIF